MAEPVTFYPGVGADEEIGKLYHLVGKITAYWAEVEDQLFNTFVAILVRSYPYGEEIRPYRAVFFSSNSYEAKMRMVHNAMKERYGADKTIMSDWHELRTSLNAFAKLRNEIAHLTPQARGQSDPKATAIVRLVPPFWKAYPQLNFDQSVGYSWDDLTKALAPFWGYDPSLNIWETSTTMLGYRLQQFSLRLLPPRPDTKIS